MTPRGRHVADAAVLVLMVVQATQIARLSKRLPQIRKAATLKHCGKVDREVLAEYM
ncbi:MAG TPA: hypothetical protein PKD55_26580 [Bellilinea sp.]|nr:hypothetical protein [Bellilinea sp.]